jgi:hypothetical protein
VNSKSASGICWHRTISKGRPGNHPPDPRPPGSESALLFFLFGRRADPLARDLGHGRGGRPDGRDRHGIGAGGDAPAHVEPERRVRRHRLGITRGHGAKLPPAMPGSGRMNLPACWFPISIRTGNFLEHEPLQRGSLWAVGRLAHARPLLARPAAPVLPAFLRFPRPLPCGARQSGRPAPSWTTPYARL